MADREEAARRIGFPTCPKCGQVRALKRVIIVGHGTAWEQGVEWCTPCGEALEAMAAQLDEVEFFASDMKRLAESLGHRGLGRQVLDSMVVSTNGTTDEQAKQ